MTLTLWDRLLSLDPLILLLELLITISTILQPGTVFFVHGPILAMQQPRPKIRQVLLSNMLVACFLANSQSIQSTFGGFWRCFDQRIMELQDFAVMPAEGRDEGSPLRISINNPVVGWWPVDPGKPVRLVDEVFHIYVSLPYGIRTSLTYGLPTRSVPLSPKKGPGGATDLPRFWRHFTTFHLSAAVSIVDSAGTIGWESMADSNRWGDIMAILCYIRILSQNPGK